MDGGRERVNASLQRRLSLALTASIVVVALVAGVFSFAAAYDEARELQDDVLREVARLVSAQRLAPLPDPPDAHFKEHDDGSRVIVQRLGQVDASGRSVDEGGTLPIPTTLSDGLHTLDLAGESFRVLVRTTAAGERIAVVQESDFRDEMAFGSAVRTLLPFLVLVPVLLLLVTQLVRAGLRPIAMLAHDVDRRGEHDLQPMATTRLPAEVRPFVNAINRLLTRIAQAMTAQRRFVADAAHELRSPLTALSLQAERLAQADMSSVAHERLATLRAGIERGRRLVDQLLALARAQSTEAAPPRPVSVQAIFRHVLEDLMPLAAARKIDIGVDGAQDAQAAVAEHDLYTLVRNLADNAIRYTPAGGRVDLSVRATAAAIEVEVRDTGPGIASAERERIFDPFFRAPGAEEVGSGLGLSIVRAIAERIGATIGVSYADEARRSGSCFTVHLARAVCNTKADARIAG